MQCRFAVQWILGILLCCFGLAPQYVGAQTVVGSVVMADNTTPVVGAIVVATQANSQPLRALTASGGRFLLRLPSPGDWHLTVLRIGFSPSGPTTVRVAAEETARVTLIAQSQPIQLQAVSTRGSSDCRVRPDTGLLVARVWEEARKAMLAVTLQSQDPTVFGEWLEYRRTTDSTGRLVTEQHVTVQRHATQRVFRSPSGDELARTGYVTTDSTGLTFYAPDPDVLLSEAFVSGHCFRMAKSPSDSIIGVAFQPTRTAEKFYDIEGTAWIDAKSSQLRSVDFAYTNLPRTRQSITSGGRVVFARLGSGLWIVRSWYAQLPNLVAPRLLNAPGTRGSRTGTVIPVVQSVHTTGGEAFRISSADSVLAAWPMPEARMQLISRDPLVSSAGARVTLRGTNVRAVSNASGFVTTGPLPAGRYEARVEVSTADSVPAHALTRVIDVSSGVTVDTVALPTMPMLLKSLCNGVSSSSAGTAMLRGTVRDVRGQVLAGAEVDVRFMRTDAKLLKSKNVRWNEETVRAKTDENGRWVMCGLPHEADIAVEARRDSLLGKRRVRVSDARMSLTVDLEVLKAEPPGGAR